jgi:hypothetical protein
LMWSVCSDVLLTVFSCLLVFLTGLSTFYQKQGYQLTGESTKWPVPQYLKVGYKDMYFWRQAKSILPGVGVDGDLTIHTDYDTQHSPRTQNMYNTLDDDEE